MEMGFVVVEVVVLVVVVVEVVVEVLVLVVVVEVDVVEVELSFVVGFDAGELSSSFSCIEDFIDGSS